MKAKAKIKAKSKKRAKQARERSPMARTHLMKFLTWLDKNIIFILTGFLLAFIPLYPKIPLFSPIERYIVRVRYEDIFVLITAIIWLIQVWRQKITFNKLFLKMILAYIVVGFLSVVSALFIIKTVPFEGIHVGKTLLHYFRYIEYFTLFFIAYSAVRTKKDIKIIFGIFVGTLIAIAIYGFGQRYFYWPVYSTMNREFSKGVRLYLTEHARLQSTFAGHYDLGAWLVVILPLILTFAFTATKRILKIGLHAVHWVGLWLMMESASRSSFAAYIISITLVAFILALHKKGWTKKISWFITRYLYLGLLVLITTIYFGGSMSERLLQVVESYPVAREAYHDFNDTRKLLMADKFVWVGTYFGFAPGERPENAISTDEAVQIIVSSDTRPTTERPDRPSDVYVDIPDIIWVATTSASGQTEIIEVETERTYSDNALKYGLSLAIRLDSLWPQAIKGFLKNPIVGSGYATLNKNALTSFTEVDGTDNNFLRTLGETGLLGFLTFYGVMIVALRMAVKAIRDDKDDLLYIFAVGYLAGGIGLLLNATYIDVYASSKVAFTFWAMTGLFVALYNIVYDKKYAKKNNK